MKSRGYTVAEILIVVSIMGVLAVFVFAAALKMTGCNGNGAPEEARKWAEKMSLHPEGVECARQDTDGDGYVSCTISSKKSDGTMELTAVECASDWTMNSGCRLQMPVQR